MASIPAPDMDTSEEALTRFFGAALKLIDGGYLDDHLLRIQTACRERLQSTGWCQHVLRASR